jgi:cytochrome P450
LRSNDQLVPGAVEESLRLLNPIRTAMRIVNEDFEYRGTTFTKGTLVALSLSGASRDGETFVDPASFMPTRQNGRDHLAFSFGVHHCLGAALARVELQELLRSILEKWADVELVEPITWKHAKLPVWGPLSIRIAVSPA